MLNQQFWNIVKKDPYSLLGIHQNDDHYILTVLYPKIDQIFICNSDTHQEQELIRQDGDFFQIVLDSEFPYYLKMSCGDHEWTQKDPYSFPPVLSDYDLYLFSEGTHRHIWEILGAHQVECVGVQGTVFAVWAPNAESVRLIGEFNHWDQNRYYMRQRGMTGVWEFFVPDLVDSVLYKFAIEDKHGAIVEKSDPYAFYAEKRPHTASKTYPLNNYTWEDQEWMNTRTLGLDQAVSIYECHLDSWIRDEQNQSLSYSDIVVPLTEYVLEHGFTHIELMPITEYPYDGSWGYQVTGYYAPTSRYGTPDDLKFFIDYLHKYNIGVIIDWVPAHFPNDKHGLGCFDGTALYEHADERLGWHHDWQTHIFNYGRKEVRQFLVGSALYWCEVFHIDGLRVDAVASMLYLDYSRKEGEWIPNKYGGRENIEAIEFLQSLHAEIGRYYPNVMTIAEESTSFPKVTALTDQGGLGFTYKWNMGWMNDTLRYFSVDPIFRSWHHKEITFSLVYAFSERYILPFSHDEVVHGKGTLLDRMPGSDWEKFANLRLMYTYMWGHPGKKLLFAGQEWAPWQEWNEHNSIDWHLNNYILHTGVRRLVQELNKVYQSESALHQIDNDPITFRWVDCDNNESGILIWIRQDYQGNKNLIVLNLNTIVKEQFRIGVPYQGIYQEILNSDNSWFGGANVLNQSNIPTQTIPWQNEEFSLEINLGPLAAVIFKIV